VGSKSLRGKIVGLQSRIISFFGRGLGARVRMGIILRANVRFKTDKAIARQETTKAQADPPILRSTPTCTCSIMPLSGPHSLIMSSETAGPTHPTMGFPNFPSLKIDNVNPNVIGIAVLHIT
jgi:hypothetical protein